MSASFLLCDIALSASVPKPNILFVTFDTTRADHIGCYGYKDIKTPNIDRLAKEGCLFEMAFTPVPLTFPSHASMFTGLYPPAHGIRNNATYELSDSIVTLPEMLKERGYKTAAFVSAYVLDRRFGLDQGFDVYDDDLVTNNEPMLSQKERRAETVTKAAIKWLEANGKDRFFLWVHYFDPHDAWSPPPPFSEKYAKNPYDGEIAYADQWLGRLIEKISALGSLDDTIICLVGDHGEGLGDHYERTHGVFIYDYAIRVPFIISGPKNLPKSRRVPYLVRLIDIPPTILDILSLKIPENMQGVSLLPLIAGKKDDPGLVLYCETIYPKSCHNWSPLEGLRTQKWKYINAPIKELYRMDKDPREERNLYKKERDQSARMEERFAALKREIACDKPVSSQITMDEETREKMKSLGYVWAPESVEKEGTYPDPKEMIKVLEYTDKALAFFEDNKYEEAIPLFEKVLKLNPGDTEAYIALGQIYDVLGDNEKSIKALEKALTLEPDNLRIYIQLGVSYMKAGKYNEGLDVFKKALDFNPRCKEAHFNTGLYHFQQQEWPKAKDSFIKTLKLDPGDAAAHNYLSVVYQREGDLANAMSEAEAVLEKDPENITALLNLGSIYHATNKIKEAQDALEKAVKIKPDFGKAHYFLGLVYFQQNRLQDAIGSFNKAIQYDSDRAEAHFNLGYIYMEKKELQKAVEEFKAALDVRPDFTQARQMLQSLEPFVNRGDKNR
ncbi:tetratricopeptide repeat protein [bacterium]|nr:tetratricopeptide repeat protein [bacterium]